MKTLKIKANTETVYGLTFGKIYNVIDENFLAFKIKDDNGNTGFYSKESFFTA